MRPDAEYKVQPPAKKQRLAEEIEITYNAAPRMPGQPFNTVLDVPHALKICTNA